jgi:hypothetical protein
MKQNIRNLWLLFLIIVFFSGLYVYANRGLIHEDYEIVKEGMINSIDGSCPDILVQQGNLQLSLPSSHLS